MRARVMDFNLIFSAKRKKIRMSPAGGGVGGGETLAK